MKQDVETQQHQLNRHFDVKTFEPGKTPESIITERAWTLKLLERSASSHHPGGALESANALTIAGLDDVKNLPVMLEALWKTHVLSCACGTRATSFKWAAIRATNQTSKFRQLRDAYLAALGIDETKPHRFSQTDA